MISESRSSLHFWLPVVLALVLGGVLRFAAIGFHSFWYDEAVGHELASQGSYADIARGRIRDNGLPPLHYMMGKLSSEMFGTDEMGYRVLPAVFGILTIFFTGILGRRLHSATVGVFAAWLVAISPFQIELSNEARVYSFVHMITALDTILLLRWLETRAWSRGLAYALCTAVMCFAHYFVVFVVASHFVLLLAQPDRYKLVARWCLFMVIVAVLWIPWVPAFIDQLTTPGNLSRYGSSWRAQIGATPVVYSVGRTFAWRESGKMMLALAAAASIIGFIVPAVLGVLVRHPKSRLSAPLLVSWVLLPIAIPLIVALTLTPMYHHRYASVGFVAFVILVAMGLVALRGPYRLIALLVIGSSTTYSMWNYYTKPLKEDWRSAAQAILAHRTADQIVLTDTDIEVVPLQYYTRRAGVALPMVYGLVVDADRDELTSVLHLNGRKIDDRPRDYTEQILSARSVTLALCVPARTAESYQAQFERRGFRTTRTQQFHRITVLNFEKVH